MNECILNNSLDKEFQGMLFPLNLMLSVLMQPKYRIQHGFVTPNGTRAHLKCFLGVIVIVITNFLIVWAFILDTTADKTDDMFALNVFDAVYYSVFSFAIFVVNCSQSQNSVKLVIKMQQAYRLFRNYDSLRRFRTRNWINIAFAVLICLIFLCCNYARDYMDYVQILFVLSLFYFDGNIIFATQIMFFLEHEVAQWLVELERFLSACSEPNHKKLTKYFDEINQREKRLFKGYLDIMEASKAYKSIFQYIILLLAIEDFVHPLMYINTFLSVSKIAEPRDHTALNIFYAIIPAFWVVKNFMLMVRLCVACQQFYLAVGEVEKACAIICSYHENLYAMNVQKLCKNVRRVNACARGGRGLRAGGALAVDAALPLRLLALLATYTVVLLQFAFL